MTKIIPIHSFRGGTGKSNTTANVATAVAAMGQRVGIIDTDIQSPGIHILFNLPPKQIKKTLNDYLWNRCTLQETSYDVTPPAIKQKKGQILLIPSSMDIAEISKILRDGYNVKRLQDGLKQVGTQLKLDFLFIDTHPGINEETLLSLSLAETLVILLRPDQQDFQGTAVIVDIARRLNVKRLLLVVNRVPAKFIPEQVKDQVEKTYNAKVAALLPNSEEMMELASRDLFYLRYPEHILSKAYQSIAEQLHEPQSSNNPFKQLFQRR
jgi:MinD-like ATPase involved in chromosome partitioning or flagellar assembly